LFEISYLKAYLFPCVENERGPWPQIWLIQQFWRGAPYRYQWAT